MMSTTTMAIPDGVYHDPKNGIFVYFEHNRDDNTIRLRNVFIGDVYEEWDEDSVFEQEDFHEEVEQLNEVSNRAISNPGDVLADAARAGVEGMKTDHSVSDVLFAIAATQSADPELTEDMVFNGAQPSLSENALH